MAIGLVLTTHAHAQVRVGQLLPRTPPGGPVVLAGDNLTSKRWAMTFGRDGVSTTALPIAVEPTKLTFTAPRELAPGDYLLQVQQDDAAPVYVATLTISEPEMVETTPRIARTVPVSSVRKLWRWGSQFDFDILGDRLDVAAAAPVTLQLGDVRVELRPCAVQPAATAPQAGATPPDVAETLRKENQSKPCYHSKGAQTLTVHGISTSRFGGPQKLSLSTARGASNETTIRISRITPRTVKGLSLGSLVALIALFGFVGRDAFSAAAGGGRHRTLQWALLDQQTNTLSLSKVQFLLWLTVVAYSYVLVQLAWVFVLGKLEMAPLPENFGWLFSMTGGTTLTSLMLTRARGPKGAGDAGPALSDLVSSGGTLAPDRAQLLLWTVIGCASYLLLVLRTPVENLNALPRIDLGLLAAMGISAAVYAGGKSVRLPGPVINQVSLDQANKTLTIKGQNLHKQAVISLDRQPAEATVTGVATPGAASESLCSELKVVFAALPFTTDDQLLRITNLDGQYAEAWFAADQPTITRVAVGAGTADEVPQRSARIHVDVAGTNFRFGSTAEWLPSGGASPTEIPAANVQVVTATSAKVTFSPGTTVGGATLTLVSPHGIRAARRVTVK